jgi:hypothetical protein
VTTIPVFLSHLPLYHGLPVPFTAMVVDGVPDFRVVDPAKVVGCVQEKICAICGVRLGEFCSFIGGPLCKENHLFADPAMHEHCAEYAAKICPFVSGNKTEYSVRPIDESKVKVIEEASAVRPTTMFILRTRTKTVKLVQHEGTVLIQAGRWARVTEIV